MLTIGKVAELSNVTADAIRYYEKEGLIAPTLKNGAGYRLYDDSALRRLHFIGQAQQCGFKLGEISQLLTIQAAESSCCSDVRKLAIEKKLQLETKIRSMKDMSKMLDGLIAGCNVDMQPVSQCPILSTLEGQQND